MTKKRIVIVGIVIVSLLLFFPVVRNIYWYQMNPFEAIVASVLDKTHWSPSYSDKSFKSIKVGFTSESVNKLIGSALYISNRKKETIWYYTVGPNNKTQSSSNGSTHVRGVLFDKNMRVKGKIYDFYFD